MPLIPVEIELKAVQQRPSIGRIRQNLTIELKVGLNVSSRVRRAYRASLPSTFNVLSLSRLSILLLYVFLSIQARGRYQTIELYQDLYIDILFRVANSDVLSLPSCTITKYNIYNLLQYLLHFKVIVYRDYSSIRNQSKHLQVFYSIDIVRYKVLARKYRQVEVLKPINVLLLLLFELPFEVLRELLDAFLYKEEKYRVISTSRTRIRQYYNKEHDQKYSKEAKEYQTLVKVQTFFFTSSLQRYYIVRSLRIT